MRYRRIICLLAWLLAGAATAQTPSTSHDDWTLQPAASHSSDYRTESLSVPGDPKNSPFHFSESRTGDALKRAPPRPMDRDAVLGNERAWLGGRPPLDCAMTPLDARCH